MIKWILGWKGMALAAVVTYAAGFASGYKVKGAFYAQAQLKVEQKTDRVIEAATTADTDTALKNADAEKELERKADEIVRSIGSRTCLSVDDVERLRRYFRDSAPR